MKIEWRTLKQSCENEKARINTLPRDHPAVSHFDVVVRLFGLLLLHRLSAKKKKRSPVENASNYGMCLRGCRENSLCLAHQWRHRLAWASRSVGI